MVWEYLWNSEKTFKTEVLGSFYFPWEFILIHKTQGKHHCEMASDYFRHKSRWDYITV